VKTLRLFISGRVQGVWYRDWMVGEATGRAVTGWVRNRTDGRVEAMVHGPAEAVDSLVEACRRGPERARVEGIDAVADSAPAEAGFRRLPSV
jgi:acylphosphatase